MHYTKALIYPPLNSYYAVALLIDFINLTPETTTEQASPLSIEVLLQLIIINANIINILNHIFFITNSLLLIYYSLHFLPEAGILIGSLLLTKTQDLFHSYLYFLKLGVK